MSLYPLILRLSRLMAILGGVALSAVVLIVCVSILGRELNGALNGWLGALAPGAAEALLGSGIGPVTGDFELVEAGVAFAIFAFLPWCQVTGGHASVDIFTRAMPPRITRALTLIIDWTFAAVLILIAVQLYDGMLGKLRTGQVTFLLQFPVWWAYAASLAGATIAAFVAGFIAVARVVEVVTGRSILIAGEAP